MKRVNLVEILGADILDIFNRSRYHSRLERFSVFAVASDLSPSSADFIEEVKSLAGSYAFNFFRHMSLEKSKKLLEKAQTIEEIEDIIKEELTDYRDGDDEYRETLGIFVTEIKNPDILDGLVHLPENSFSCDVDVESRIKELKSDENFKEALELTESFNELKDLINNNGPSKYQEILGNS